MSDIAIIRTERRRRYSDAEKAALLAEVDRGGCTVAEVARRHGVAESLLYNWRSHRRASASVASEPLQFISYGDLTNAVVDLPATVTPPTVVSAPAPPAGRREGSERSVSDDLVRPHPGSRPDSRVHLTAFLPSLMYCSAVPCWQPMAAMHIFSPRSC